MTNNLTMLSLTPPPSTATLNITKRKPSIISKRKRQQRRKLHLSIFLCAFFSSFCTQVVVETHAESTSQNAAISPWTKYSISSSSALRPLRGGVLTKRRKGQDNTNNNARNAAAVTPTTATITAETTVRTPEQEASLRKTLNLIRILFFTYYGSLGALMPYLPVYYHSLGHSGSSIGLLGAVKPLTTFFVAPVWGIISDTSANISLVLKMTFLTSLFGQLMVAMRDDVRFLVGVVFITAFFNAPVKSLIDSMVMQKLKEMGGENCKEEYYGKLRLWGQLGFGVCSSFVGWILSKSHPGPTGQVVAETMKAASEAAADGVMEEEVVHMAEEVASWTLRQSNTEYVIDAMMRFWHQLAGFKLAFLAHGLLSIPAFYCIRLFQRYDKNGDEECKEGSRKSKADATTSAPRKEKDGAHILEGLNLLIHNGDALLFFFLVFVVGTSSGCVENFAYVRMKEMGGTGKEMGLSRLVSSAAGAPMFWFSGPLTKMFGADRILIMSLMSYVCRFFIYAFMRNPYQGLPAEALRGLTFAAFWSTGTVYAHKISPPCMGTTMLMFFNAMYGGLGQSLGAIIGGKLQSKFGTVKTFIYSGIFDLVFVGVVVMYLSLRKDSNFRNPTPMMPKEKRGDSNSE